MRKITTAVTLAISSFYILMPLAIAHDEAAVNHDDAHTELRAEHDQVHDLVGQGAITQDEHRQLDAQLRAEHRDFHQNINGNSYQNYATPQNYYTNNSSGYYPQSYNSAGYSGYYPQSYNNSAYSGYDNQRYNSGNAYPWNEHRSQHQSLKSVHRDVHQLVRDGVITPQEHAALDAQLKADHSQSHARYAQNNFGNQGLRRANGWFN